MARDDHGSGFAALLHKFGPVQAVFLFIGFVIFVAGVPSGVKLDNRTLMIGTCVMALGIVGHYWSHPRYADLWTGEKHIRGGLKWGRLFIGVMFLPLAAASAYFAYASN